MGAQEPGGRPCRLHPGLDAFGARAAILRVRPPDLYAFNVQNGTLFFGRRDGKAGYRLRPHDPAHLITKISPATYEPAARCPPL